MILQDILTEFARAPLWAQVAMTLFACLFLYMALDSFLQPRRYRSRLASLAGAFGQPVRSSDQGPFFRATVGGRAFDIRYEYRSSGRGSSYRGPTGHLLVAATRLAAPRWEMHQVDIQRVGRVLRKLAGSMKRTGDPAFDARFLVREDGMPVREGWLDAPTRAAIQQFYESPVAQGPLWIQEQQVSHIASPPWTGIDATTLRSMLERQAALASALEHTAGWRGEPITPLP